MKGIVRNDKLVLPELSYKIMGAIFEVSNELGVGYQEKYYYRALKAAFEKSGLKVKTQVYLPFAFCDMKLGNYFFGFFS